MIKLFFHKLILKSKNTNNTFNRTSWLWYDFFIS